MFIVESNPLEGIVVMCNPSLEGIVVMFIM